MRETGKEQHYSHPCVLFAQNTNLHILTIPCRDITAQPRTLFIPHDPGKLIRATYPANWLCNSKNDEEAGVADGCPAIWSLVRTLIHQHHIHHLPSLLDWQIHEEVIIHSSHNPLICFYCNFSLCLRFIAAHDIKR